TGAAHVVQFRVIGVGQRLHQVLADLHDPVHDGLPALPLVLLLLLLLLLQLAHWSAAPPRRFIARAEGVRYVTTACPSRRRSLNQRQISPKNLSNREESNERPPVRLSHAGFDQDLSGQPQGAR